MERISKSEIIGIIIFVSAIILAIIGFHTPSMVWLIIGYLLGLAFISGTNRNRPRLRTKWNGWINDPDWPDASVPRHLIISLIVLALCSFTVGGMASQCPTCEGNEGIIFSTIGIFLGWIVCLIYFFQHKEDMRI